MFLFCLVFAMFCARLFICALWSPAGKGLTSWLSFVVSSVSLSLSHWYPGSGVVLDCVDSWSLHHYLLSCVSSWHISKHFTLCTTLSLNIKIQFTLLSCIVSHINGWERSGLVVECLTCDRVAAGSSLTGVTALWSLRKTKDPSSVMV